MQLVKETLDREEEFINRNQEVEAAFNTMNNLYDKMLQLNVTKTWVE